MRSWRVGVGIDNLRDAVPVDRASEATELAVGAVDRAAGRRLHGRRHVSS